MHPPDYNLVVWAMQEPQYRSPGVRELLDAVARKKVPCMSIMNMPPLPYLKRIPGLATDALRSCYTDASVWDNFDPGLLTLCSPDPQAIRPPGEEISVLHAGAPGGGSLVISEAPEVRDLKRQIVFRGLELRTRALMIGTQRRTTTDTTIAAHPIKDSIPIDRTAARSDSRVVRH